MDKLAFFAEQLKLINAHAIRYSSATILWAFQPFSLFSPAYCMLRTSFLTLPHPSYLKKLASAFSIQSGGANTVTQEEYLRQMCAALSTEGEKRVTLMLDEIHLKNEMSNKGGNLKAQQSTQSCQRQIQCKYL